MTILQSLRISCQTLATVVASKGFYKSPKLMNYSINQLHSLTVVSYQWTHANTPSAILSTSMLELRRAQSCLCQISTEITAKSLWYRTTMQPWTLSSWLNLPNIRMSLTNRSLLYCKHLIVTTFNRSKICGSQHLRSNSHRQILVPLRVSNWIKTIKILSSNKQARHAQ